MTEKRGQKAKRQKAVPCVSMAEDLDVHLSEVRARLLATRQDDDVDQAQVADGIIEEETLRIESELGRLEAEMTALDNVRRRYDELIRRSDEERRKLADAHERVADAHSRVAKAHRSADAVTEVVNKWLNTGETGVKN